MFGWKRFVKRQRRALFKMVSDKDHHDLNTLGLFVDYEDKERRLILQNCVLRETSLGAGNRGILHVAMKSCIIDYVNICTLTDQFLKMCGSLLVPSNLRKADAYQRDTKP